jgi:hypothetical protein
MLSYVEIRGILFRVNYAIWEFPGARKFGHSALNVLGGGFFGNRATGSRCFFSSAACEPLIRADFHIPSSYFPSLTQRLRKVLSTAGNYLVGQTS